MICTAYHEATHRPLFMQTSVMIAKSTQSNSMRQACYIVNENAIEV